MVLPSSAIADFVIKQNDTARPLPSTLRTRATPTDDWQVVDLTGATVQFHMRPLTEGSALKVDAAATIVSALGGQVAYSWAAGDTDMSDYPAGTKQAQYLVEWEVTFADGTIGTFPNDRDLHVLIWRDLG